MGLVGLNGQEDCNTFLKAVNAMRVLASNAASGNAYGKSWEAEFRSKEIDEAFQRLREAEPYSSEEFWKKVFALPQEVKRVLGFVPFEKGDEKMCIPLWIWQLLPDDMKFDGEPKGKLDNDSRFGCVWWRA